MACIFKRSNGIYYAAIYRSNKKRVWFSLRTADKDRAMKIKQFLTTIERERRISNALGALMEEVHTGFSKKRKILSQDTELLYAVKQIGSETLQEILRCLDIVIPNNKEGKANV